MRAVLARPERLAWCALSAAGLSVAAGYAYYYVAAADLADPPYPSGADVLWLTGWALTLLGLLLLLRDRLTGFRRTIWLDAG